MATLSYVHAHLRTHLRNYVDLVCPQGPTDSEIDLRLSGLTIDPELIAVQFDNCILPSRDVCSQGDFHSVTILFVKSRQRREDWK
ncbi:hypothetical protein BDZ94DRAFT_1277443 [Collybia nuda]|uniref:Uncharacterized protein n=1 Tax=Collybia nuda TaxID=64659 RepID=A0A9P5XRU3_9AGAR|nr:hypothetical protein BDZ94DRAFT_1277443 [Collybia nuda]